MQFEDLIRKRRMVRHFASDSVDHDVLERIAAIAQRAPSAGFSQGQRLLIVTDAEIRRRIARLCGEEEMSAAGYDPWLSEAPAHVIPCVSEEVYHRRYREPDKLQDTGTEINWPVPYWWMDLGATVMLVLLAAVDAGLAAGFAGTDDAGYVEMRAMLGIPDEFSPVGVIPIGHPLPDKRSPSLARGWVPSTEFARWERWDD